MVFCYFCSNSEDQMPVKVPAILTQKQTSGKLSW